MGVRIGWEKQKSEEEGEGGGGGGGGGDGLCETVRILQTPTCGPDHPLSALANPWPLPTSLAQRAERSVLQSFAGTGRPALHAGIQVQPVPLLRTTTTTTTTATASSRYIL